MYQLYMNTGCLIRKGVTGFSGYHDGCKESIGANQTGGFS